MLVSTNETLLDFAKQYRNYGKHDYKVQGHNYRMNEFIAAIGCVQVDRLDDIVSWKNEYAQRNITPKHSKRVEFPEGMVSGYYKYIVFDPIDNSTGKVYEQPCHRLMGNKDDLPNTDMIARNHWCVPLYYRGNE